ncbi:MAG: RsmB/NOP family class I SAM-dependent RNA methyltransferase [Candidatus Hodarchaeales archaeon]
MLKGNENLNSLQSIIQTAASVISYYEENQISLRVAMKIVPNLIDNIIPEIYSQIHALVFETVRHHNILNRIIHINIQKHLNEKLSRNFRNILRVITYLLTLSPSRENERVWIICSEIIHKTADNEDILPLISNFFTALKTWSLESLLEEISDPEEKLAVQFAHPTWLVRDFIKFYGLETTISILKANNKGQSVYIRLNLLNEDIEVIKNRLRKEHVVFEEDSDFYDVLKISSWKIPLPRLSSFKEGLYYMQDKGSALISHVLDPKKGESILDACAAPGGKTTHIALIQQDSGKIVALDNNIRRMKELLNKINLYKLNNVFPIISDLRMGTNFKIKFDKILVDAPCSGSGTFSSRPDSKWRIDRHHAKWLSNLQFSLLESASTMLKNSSESALIYSTCSLLPLENEEVIQRFLNNHPKFELRPQKIFIGTPSPQFPLAQRLFPHKNHTEGFTIFKLGIKENFN